MEKQGTREAQGRVWRGGGKRGKGEKRTGGINNKHVKTHERKEKKIIYKHQHQSFRFNPPASSNPFFLITFVWLPLVPKNLLSPLHFTYSSTYLPPPSSSLFFNGLPNNFCSKSLSGNVSPCTKYKRSFALKETKGRVEPGRGLTSERLKVVGTRRESQLIVSAEKCTSEL